MNTLNSVILALFEAVSEEKFWDFVRRCDWLRDHNYDRIKHKMIHSLTKEEAAAYRDTYNRVYLILDTKLDNVVSRVGDDSYSDLLAHIVGSGKETYDAVMNDPSIAQKIIDDADFVESFSYVFPHPRDYKMLDKNFWIKRATKLIKDISDPEYVHSIKTEVVAKTYKDMLKRLRLVTQGKFNRATENYDYRTWSIVDKETRGMWGPANLINDLKKFID